MLTFFFSPYSKILIFLIINLNNQILKKKFEGVGNGGAATLSHPQTHHIRATQTPIGWLCGHLKPHGGGRKPLYKEVRGGRKPPQHP
jgi:hypothetical protein